MPDLYRQYNQFQSAINPNLQKALTSATGVGESLSPQELERNMTEVIIKLAPEIFLLLDAASQGQGKKSEFNRVVGKPRRGGAMGESATTPISNSKVAPDEVQKKIIRRKGAVTNFLSDVSTEYIDAAAYEMEQNLQAHVWDIIYYSLYGNTGNQWEYDGLDKFIKTNRDNSRSRGGEVPTSLSFLDDIISASNRAGGANHRRVIEMSPELLSKVSSLLTNVRLNQGLTANGLTQVNIGGGWYLNAYRDIPIIETTFTRPVEKMSSTITLAQEATGGSLSDGTYYIQIAPVTTEGEQIASDEQSITLTGGTATQRIKITFDAPHQTSQYVEDGGSVENNAYAYRIYMSDSSEVETLKKIETAFVYDSQGTVLDEDTYWKGNATYPIYITSATYDTNSVTAAMSTDVPYLADIENGKPVNPPETVIFWDMDPIQGLGKLKYANTAGDRFEGLVTTKQLAEIDDYIQFLIKTYCALIPSNQRTSAMIRGVKTA